MTENAADVWPLYEGTDKCCVWQLQLKHEARPSCLFDCIGSWNDYLTQARVDDPSMPGSLSDMQAQCGAKLVLADATDPDSIGFAPPLLVKRRVRVHGSANVSSCDTFVFVLACLQFP